MAQSGQAESKEDNPLRDLADIIAHRASRHAKPRPETDRRTNYREPPTPPGTDLTVTSIEEGIRRDPEIIEHTYEVARATAHGHATERRTIRIDATTGHEILDYLDAHRSTLPAELRERIDATADRLRRQAYAAVTRTRLVCPRCGGQTVVPTPDLRLLVCIDYGCAPLRPRAIDPTQAQPAERRITSKDLALMLHTTETAVRKRLWRAKVQPVRVGAHNRHEYRWADVSFMVPHTARKTDANTTANREARTGRIEDTRVTAAA
jgi:hypothetical protein